MLLQEWAQKFQEAICEKTTEFSKLFFWWVERRLEFFWGEMIQIVSCIWNSTRSVASLSNLIGFVKLSLKNSYTLKLAARPCPLVVGRLLSFLGRPIFRRYDSFRGCRLGQQKPSEGLSKSRKLLRGSESFISGHSWHVTWRWLLAHFARSQSSKFSRNRDWWIEGRLKLVSFLVNKNIKCHSILKGKKKQPVFGTELCRPVACPLWDHQESAKWNSWKPCSPWIIDASIEEWVEWHLALSNFPWWDLWDFWYISSTKFSIKINYLAILLVMVSENVTRT